MILKVRRERERGQRRGLLREDVSLAVVPACATSWIRVF